MSPKKKLKETLVKGVSSVLPFGWVGPNIEKAIDTFVNAIEEYVTERLRDNKNEL